MNTPKNHLSEIVLRSIHKICLTDTSIESVFYKVICFEKGRTVVCLYKTYFKTLHTGKIVFLNHISLASFLNSADPYQMPQNVASDQGFHCLLQNVLFKF